MKTHAANGTCLKPRKTTWPAYQKAEECLGNRGMNWGVGGQQVGPRLRWMRKYSFLLRLDDGILVTHFMWSSPIISHIKRTNLKSIYYLTTCCKGPGFEDYASGEKLFFLPLPSFLLDWERGLGRVHAPQVIKGRKRGLKEMHKCYPELRDPGHTLWALKPGSPVLFCYPLTISQDCLWSGPVLHLPKHSHLCSSQRPHKLGVIVSIHFRNRETEP